MLLAEAHASRKDRRRRKFETIVYDAISDAAAKVKGSGLTLRTNDRLFGLRKFDLVMYENLTPVVAVASVFQIGTGGRQSDVLRELSLLQDELVRREASLLVIADGPGFMYMPALVRNVLPKLRHFTNLAGVRRGELPRLITDAILDREALLTARSVDRAAALQRIADEAISQGRAVTPDVLDMSAELAEAFMIRYQATRPKMEKRHKGMP